MTLLQWKIIDSLRFFQFLGKLILAIMAIVYYFFAILAAGAIVRTLGMTVLDFFDNVVNTYHYYLG